MTKGTIALLAAALTAVLLLVWVLGPFGDGGSPRGGDPSAVSVDARGGTFEFAGGLVVTVPEGAVERATQLRVTDPVPLAQEDRGPFSELGAVGLRFDVSLGEDVQPREPLEVTIPLQGRYRPDAASGNRPLLYTPAAGGNFQLVPTEVRDGALHGWLAHLSPKYLTYVDDQALLDSFYPQQVEQHREQCAQEATVSGQRAAISGESRGWSLDEGSPIFACLYPGTEGYVRVGISNRIDYILSVAATDNVRLAASRGDAEDEVVTLLAARLFPDQRIKAYAGVDGELVGSVRVDDLPATLELRGDPNTFLAEGAWRAISVVVGVFVGKDATGTAALVKHVVEDVEVIACLQDFLAPALGGDLGAITELVLRCAQPIVEAAGEEIDAFAVFARWQELLGLIEDLAGTVTKTVNGISLQLRNTISVQVVALLPTVDPCSGDEAFTEVVDATDPGLNDDGTYAKYELVGCTDGYVVGRAYPVVPADIDFIVFQQAAAGWTTPQLYFVGRLCGESGLPEAVDRLTACIELSE